MLCGWLHISWDQLTMLPWPSMPPASFTAIAEPYGAHMNSSSRIHCSFTGRPLVARAIRAASSATSSAPLWP